MDGGDGRDRVIPTFRVPFTRGEDTVRTLVGSVGPALHNANHEVLVEGPPIALTPHNVRQSTMRGSTLRDEVLAAIVQIRARTGSETVARREVVAEVLSGDAKVQKQSVYKALRRMSGREAGAAVDLEDLGNGRLRVRLRTAK